MTREYEPVVIALLLVALLGAAPATTAAAAEPTTADEFLDALREYEGSEALESYSQLEAVRSQAVTETQVGEFSEQDRRRLNATLHLLDSFSEAYRLAQAGDHVASLEEANHTSQYVERLREMGAERYAVLASLALDRFHRERAEALFAAAEEADSTPERLRLLSHAASAYRRAGETERYSRVTARETRMRSQFQADRERLDESLSAAAGFVSDCPEACESPVAAATTLGVGVFDGYVEARAANRHATEAFDLADRHGLDEQRRNAAAAAEATDELRSSFAVASALVLFGYGLVLAVVAAFVAHRVTSWAVDREDGRVGGIVPNLEVHDA